MDNEKENFLATKRGVALLKLGGFVLFFVFMGIMSNSVPKVPRDNTSSSSKEDIVSSSKAEAGNLSFTEIKTKFLNANYSFSAQVIIGEVKHFIMGSRLENEVSGFYTLDSQTTKFIISNNTTYAIINNRQVQKNDLFKGLELDLIDGKYLLQLTNTVEPMIHEENGIKKYVYEIEDKTISIHLDETIKRIEVNQSSGDSYQTLYNY